jgi:hypothetical protein
MWEWGCEGGAEEGYVPLCVPEGQRVIKACSAEEPCFLTHCCLAIGFLSRKKWLALSSHRHSSAPVRGDAQGRSYREESGFRLFLPMERK